jgi:prepilin-type N-terminal cleavage/methylation domain-containing protein
VKRPLRPARGLSLVELLVGLAIAALVLASLPPMLQAATSATRAEDKRAALEQEANFAIARIAARIRITPPSQIGANPDDWFKPAIYSHSVSTKVLVEKQDKKSYVRAESVTAFSIDVPAATEDTTLVQVSLALERDGDTANANATVRMGSAL